MGSRADEKKFRSVVRSCLGSNRVSQPIVHCVSFPTSDAEPTAELVLWGSERQTLDASAELLFAAPVAEQPAIAFVCPDALLLQQRDSYTCY